MSEMMTVYPVPGRLVLDPATFQSLPAAGLAVPRNSFWLRRLADGDVTTSMPEQGEEG